MRSNNLCENSRSRRIFLFCAVAFFCCVLLSSLLAQTGSGPEDGLYAPTRQRRGKNFMPRAVLLATVCISRE